MAIKQGKEQVLPVQPEWTWFKILFVVFLLHLAMMTGAQPVNSHQVSDSTTPHEVHPSVHRSSRPLVDNPNPSFRYMYKLYRMMARQDKDCCVPYKGDNHKAETITGIPGVAGRYWSYCYTWKFCTVVLRVDFLPNHICVHCNFVVSHFML